MSNSQEKFVWCGEMGVYVRGGEDSHWLHLTPMGNEREILNLMRIITCVYLGLATQRKLRVLPGVNQTSDLYI